MKICLKKEDAWRKIFEKESGINIQLHYIIFIAIGLYLYDTHHSPLFTYLGVLVKNLQ